MTVPADLAQRAERHGLERAPNGWFRTGQPQGVVVYPWSRGHEGQGWAWSSPTGRDCIEYPTEESALRAALDWLDTQHPERAHRPEPSAQVLPEFAALVCQI